MEKQSKVPHEMFISPENQAAPKNRGPESQLETITGKFRNVQCFQVEMLKSALI